MTEFSGFQVRVSDFMHFVAGCEPYLHNAFISMIYCVINFMGHRLVHNRKNDFLQAVITYQFK
jgi:hypothetical protein